MADGLEELRASGGKPGRALISEAKSGRKWKADPSQILWKVTMRVMPDDTGPFNVTIQVPYPATQGGPSLGSLVSVLYDPRDHSKVAIDPAAPTESWGEVQAAQQNHIIQQAMSQSSGGAAIFAGGRWISRWPRGHARRRAGGACRVPEPRQRAREAGQPPGLRRPHRRRVPGPEGEAPRDVAPPGRPGDARHTAHR